MCKIEEEIVNHLFVNWSFAKQVWREVFQGLNVLGVWNSDTLEHCMR
jgi:hypothetical protein